ncbi:MAG: ABC transporter substrate-binding protein, partial [Actinobacteria bacterium]|nr:ABC transporter substrate-binding protein [Actinomycetota bacterium]
MGKLCSALVVGALTVVTGLAIAACGSSSNGDNSASKDATLKIGSVLPDNYDPVLLQTVQGNQALQLVYTGLLTYGHAEGAAGATLIPGVAEALPTSSADKKTYTFKLRPGLKYSDGSPVVASDYEHTVKRLTYLGGPYSSFVSGIVGIPQYAKAKKPNGDISGITTNDSTGEIKVRLSAPDSKFLFATALVSSAPTPAAKSPFKATPTIPGVGPYKMHIINASREFILTKTPGFNVPGLAKGNFEKIDVVKETVPKMTQDVIDDKLDFMTEDPTGDLLPQVQAKYKDRFRMDPNPPNTYWFFLNETTKPFDKLSVRQAVNYAIDSRALARIFGGRLQPTCNFLPVGYAGNGYQKIDPCPYGDPNGPPNMAKAKALVAASGYEGMKVTVWGNNKDPRPAIVEYLRSVMAALGFKAQTKILDQQVYFATVGDKKTKAQAGFTGWFSDFPHPGDFFEPNLSAKALASSPTFNFQFKSNPVVDKGIKDLAGDDPAKVASKWAAIDKSVIENANATVYGSELATSFFSDRMDAKNCSGVSAIYK